MADTSLPAARLRELLCYDPETGVFTWRQNVGRWGRVKAGTVAGGVNAHGHVVIRVQGASIYAHRIAFLLMTGEFPSFSVDHLDGVKTNNAWANLRDVSQHTNTENRRTPTRGKASGLPLGVSIDRRDNRIRADITVKGKAISLGRFNTPEEAHAAYVEAKRRLHEGCTI